MNRFFTLTTLSATIFFSTNLGADHETLSTFERVSIASDGTQANNTSCGSAISADGRYVAFISKASNLVSGGVDQGLFGNVFLHDRHTGQTTQVSMAYDGTQPSRAMEMPLEGSGYYDDNFSYCSQIDISDDGQLVVFSSKASNLVSGDTNGATDVFVRDMVGATSVRVSALLSDGTRRRAASSSPAISPDGSYIAFISGLESDGNHRSLSLYDRSTGTLTEIPTASLSDTRPHSFLQFPSVSNNGGLVTFTEPLPSVLPSTSADLYADLDIQVFVRNLTTAQTNQVSVSSGSLPANGMSGAGKGTSPISRDGRYIAFTSKATNLVSGDENAHDDIFVRDLTTNTTSRVSVATDGSVGFGGHGDSWMPSISGDGRFVAFVSFIRFVPEDTDDYLDLFIHDRTTSETALISNATTAEESEGWRPESHMPKISADGRYVAFLSFAKNLVLGDTNDVGDIFVARNPFMPIPPPVTHAACDAAHQCVQVTGAGTNQCTSNADCAPPPPVTHAACDAAHQCVQVTGAGTNLCSTNGDCAPPPPVLSTPPPAVALPGEEVVDDDYAACNDDYQCVEMPGPGDDVCASNDDCWDMVSCTDSDGGRKPSTYGEVLQTVEGSDSPVPYVDQCHPQKNVYMKEFYCNPTTSHWEKQYFQCQDGCRNGACLSNRVRPIFDPGWDYF